MDEYLERTIEKYCTDELIDSEVYNALSAHEKDPKRREILKRMSVEEKNHSDFWRELLGRDCKTKGLKTKILLMLLLRKVLGLTFVSMFLERHEEEVVHFYKGIEKSLPPEASGKLKAIIEDEERHELEIISSLDEKIVKYMSFVILGLADAIVEINGVHAGFLGVTESTIVTGIAGLVVGLSAAISMSSAAYLQAKHDVGKSPKTSAIMTGIAYILAVLALALPYFLIRRMISAFAVSVSLGIVMIAGFTYYASILQRKEFLREFLESTALMMGTALASYIFGDALGTFFGIRGIF
ncbi:MAG: VIT1/CCC1 family protein [Desulfurococcales archaeon]|jgi:VIT1/CCC1 family predicted Fe2+/Mn2+ transporter